MSIRHNQYWLPGAGISRQVLQAEITRYLGGDATSRPGYSPEGEAGFIITAVRDFTPAQLHDIRAASENYERERVRENQRGVRRDYPGSSAQANLHHTGQPPLPPAPAGYQHDGYGRLIPIPPTGQPYSGTQYAQTDHYAAVRGGYEAPNAAGYPNYRTEAPREYNTGAYQPSGYPPAPQYGGSSSQPGSLPPGYYWDARLQRALPYPSS